jgi:hypothetical protein
MKIRNPRWLFGVLIQNSLSVPNEAYSRNASSTLNLISTYLFLHTQTYWRWNFKAILALQYYFCIILCLYLKSLSVNWRRICDKMSKGKRTKRQPTIQNHYTESKRLSNKVFRKNNSSYCTRGIRCLTFVN